MLGGRWSGIERRGTALAEGKQNRETISMRKITDRRQERMEPQLPESALERRRRLFDEVFADFDARGVGLRMVDNLPRAALHDRSQAVRS